MARTPRAALAQADRIIGFYRGLETRVDAATGQTYYAPTPAQLASARAQNAERRVGIRTYLRSVLDSGALSLPSYLTAVAALDDTESDILEGA
jgi:hypothetical protein